MKTIKVIDEDELEDKLLHTAYLISDEICELSDAIIKFHKKYPQDDPMGPALPEWYVELYMIQDKFEKKIAKSIYDYLMRLDK